MAISKIIPRHVTQNRTIKQFFKDVTEYEKNKKKTKNGEYISAYQCSPDTVIEDFVISKQLYQLKTGRYREKDKDVVSYLLIQSFPVGEISPEDAHKLGYELALAFTKKQHQFLVSTHIDKSHIHNHIEFNSTN